MRLLSPREVADALGVSESSLKRWVDAGKITAARTDGGHRRIALAEAMRFIRETGAPLAHPEALGMPEVAAANARAARGEDQLFAHVLAGDAVGVRGWLLSRYLAGANIEELSDGPIRDAMARLGELWRHDEDGIFIEHRGTDACVQAVAQLRANFAPRSDGPVAVGGSPPDDPYLLPPMLAATVIASVGMRAVNLGPNTPLAALQAAVAHHRPQLVWVSVSTPLEGDRARAIAAWLLALPAGTLGVVGGRSSDAVGAADPRVRVCASMTELAEVTRSLLRPRPLT